MKYHIGIITARKSLRNLQNSDALMRELCDITYLPYSTTMELTNLYLENANKFDGFLFSGQYPHDYIIENVCAISKPCRFLDLADRDYYRVIARLHTHYPNIDIRRVVFEGIGRDFRTVDQTPIFDDISPADRQPHFNNFSYTFMAQNLHQRYDLSIKKYCQMWREGTADMIVTRLTNIADQLKAENVPHILLQPCPATVMETFKNLLADIQSTHIQNNLTACCVIQIAHDAPTLDEFELLGKRLDDFNAQQNMCFVLRRDGDSFDAITSGSAVRELTSGYTTCLLTSSLFEMLPFSTHIGWGVGFDIVSAHQKALRAIQESRRDNSRYTYMVNEANELVGPLCGDRTISYQLRPSDRTNRIAKVLGISPINLEKLISLQEKKHISEFSSSDLAFYLDITPRSATRILQKLVQYGAATQINSLHLNNRGRPASIYEIDLERVTLL